MDPRGDGEGQEKGSLAPPPARSSPWSGSRLSLSFLGVVLGAGLAGASYPYARCELGPDDPADPNGCDDEQKAMVSFVLEASRILSGVILGSSGFRAP